MPFEGTILDQKEKLIFKHNNQNDQNKKCVYTFDQNEINEEKEIIIKDLLNEISTEENINLKNNDSNININEIDYDEFTLGEPIQDDLLYNINKNKNIKV